MYTIVRANGEIIECAGNADTADFSEVGRCMVFDYRLSEDERAALRELGGAPFDMFGCGEVGCE